MTPMVSDNHPYPCLIRFSKHSPIKIRLHHRSFRWFPFGVSCVIAFAPGLILLWNSIRREAALSRIFPNVKLGSLHLILFLRHHMNQAIVAKSSSCFACSPTNATRSVNCEIAGWSFKTHPKTVSHTVSSCLHSYSACIVFSTSIPHRGHVGSSSTFLRSKLQLVGKASEHARHRKIFILFGTLIFQRRRQKTLLLVISDPDALFWVSSSQSSWYPVFTEYIPSLHLGQVMQSAWLEKHIGMDFIFATSKGR